MDGKSKYQRIVRVSLFLLTFNRQKRYDKGAFSTRKERVLNACQPDPQYISLIQSKEVQHGTDT